MSGAGVSPPPQIARTDGEARCRPRRRGTPPQAVDDGARGMAELDHGDGHRWAERDHHAGESEPRAAGGECALDLNRRNMVRSPQHMEVGSAAAGAHGQGELGCRSGWRRGFRCKARLETTANTNAMEPLRWGRRVPARQGRGARALCSIWISRTSSIRFELRQERGGLSWRKRNPWGATAQAESSEQEGVVAACAHSLKNLGA